MRRQLELFSILTATLLVVGVCTAGSQLYAQQASTSSVHTAQAQEPQSGGQQYPGQQSPGQPQSPSSRPAEPPGQQTPDTQAGQTQDMQTFTGMVVKSGDKYVLQDEKTGKTYDIDHQTEVGQHAGKRVRVNGTLDPSGKTIHIQPATK